MLATYRRLSRPTFLGCLLEVGCFSPEPFDAGLEDSTDAVTAGGALIDAFATTTDGADSDGADPKVFEPTGDAASSAGTTGSVEDGLEPVVVCVTDPAPPANGTYADGCNAAEVDATCALQCVPGFEPTGSAVCRPDGSWSSAECLDTRDVDRDGLRRYPWGPDLDDDGDGERTFLLGGDDYDDADVTVQSLRGRGDFELDDVYPLGPSAGPTGITAGDFDNDGVLDLATTNQNNDTVSIFVGNGDGTFEMHQTFEVDEESGGGRIATGDFDRDGHLDLMATFGCRVLRGLGDGTFEPGFDAPGTCLDMTVVDVNADDRLDVVTAGGNSVSTLIGGGDGTFAAVQTSCPDCAASAAGFLDGDSIPDVVVVEQENFSIRTFLGNGVGGYVLADRLDDGSFFGDFGMPRDVTGNGRADVVASTFIDDRIGLVAGDGNGGIGAEALTAVEGAGPDGIFLADLDGDGRTDLAFADQGSGFGVAMGTGFGDFGPATTTEVGDNPFALVGGDFNGDGCLDFAVASIGSGDVAILLGRP